MKKMIMFFSVIVIFSNTSVFSQSIQEISKYNVEWNTPSDNSYGAMPLGNGSEGVNSWVEPNGDLQFYISGTDFFGDDQFNIKQGKVRVKFSDNPFVRGFQFNQTLELKEGAIVIKAGEKGKAVNIRLWMDVNNPVIHIQGTSDIERTVEVQYELWRKLKLADSPTSQEALYGDVVINDNTDSLIWYHQNSSATKWGQRLETEGLGPDIKEKVKDPLQYLTFGSLMQGKGFKRSGAQSLKATGTKNIDIAITLLTKQCEKPEEWVNLIESKTKEYAKINSEKAFAAHKKWWGDFWERSWINLSGFPDAYTFTQKYICQRYINACTNRGETPVPFNGNIYNVDAPKGTWSFLGRLKTSVDADYRAWGDLTFMWQNTRHIYYPMIASGDFDLMKPLKSYVFSSFGIAKARAKNWFGYDSAAVQVEAVNLKGLSVFGKRLPPHLSSHFLAGIELTAMLTDYYIFNPNEKFLADTLLPCADAYIEFFNLKFPKKDVNGKRIIGPTGAVETYQGVINSVTELTGLKYLLGRLLSIGKNEIGESRYQKWSSFLNELPEVSTRTVCGKTLLAVGDRYIGREIVESPEFYSVFPFRQITHYKNNMLDAARLSFALRMISLDGINDRQWVRTGGWSQMPTVSAYLGLPKETAFLLGINFHDRTPYADSFQASESLEGFVPKRFPAFWNAHFDWTPDQCHGGVTINALQSMLVQYDDRKIYLLPSFPENWNVDFKLYAPYNTVIECSYKDGKIVLLRVTPESRKADIVNLATLEHRIQTMVRVAGTDYSYLFGVDPLLDGVIAPKDIDTQKISGGWLSKYGESLYDTKAGPFKAGDWGVSVFKGNTIYLHITNPETKEITLPPIPLSIMKTEVLTEGKVKVNSDAQRIKVTCEGYPKNSADVIVKLEMSGEILPIVEKQGYENSLSKTATASASNEQPGFPAKNAIDNDDKTEWKAQPTDSTNYLQLTFPKQESISRAEIHFALPVATIGKGYPFEIQYTDNTGKWITLFNEMTYGKIWAKPFDKTLTDKIRVKSRSAGISQFDVYNTEK